MTNERIRQTFFLQDPAVVAKGLLGRYIVRATAEGDIYARMTEVAAWDKAEGTDPEFAEQNLGGISVSKRRGNYLIDITCGAGNGCVTIWGAEFETEDEGTYKAKSPGRVSEALEVTDALTGTSIVKNATLWIEGSPASLDDVLERSIKMPANCKGRFYIR